MSKSTARIADDRIKPGLTFTFFPRKTRETDNLHFPAVVEKVGVIVRCKVYSHDDPEGAIKYISKSRLVDQMNLF